MVTVKNLPGFVTVNSDGSWNCLREHKHKEEHHEDPVSFILPIWPYVLIFLLSVLLLFV